MYLVLHNIRSAFNVGAMFRTGDAVGLTGVHLCGYTPSPIDRFNRPCTKLTKVSLGGEDTVPWEQHASVFDSIRALKEKGIAVWALEIAPDAELYTGIQLSREAWGKTALIVGNEVAGVEPEVLALCDKVVSIPMYGIKESLNVGVAAGIVLYHLRHAA